MEKIKICSLIQDGYLEFEKLSDDPCSGIYGVVLSNPFFLLNKKVHYYNYNFLEYPSSFFAAMAREEKPWDGKIEWVSLELDFKLTGLCSELGQVTIHIYVEERDAETKYDRTAEDEITLGFGELKNISKKMDEFFNVKKHKKFLENEKDES